VEETGLAAHQVTRIGRYNPIPGLAPQEITVYTTTVTDAALRACVPMRNVDDIVDMTIVDYAAVRGMAGEGEITDGVTLASIALLETARPVPAAQQ
jgi:hypothetical protein